MTEWGLNNLNRDQTDRMDTNIYTEFCAICTTRLACYCSPTSEVGVSGGCNSNNKLVLGYKA